MNQQKQSLIHADCWDTIDTVLLDMDGTLLDLHFDNYFWLQYLPQKFAELHGLSFDQAMAELNKSFVGLRGTLNWYCLDFWTELTSLPIAELKLDVQSKIAMRPYVIEFLSTLRQQQKRLVIVTNAHRDSLNIKLQCTQLDQWVDRIISSHDYQQPKESSLFWDTLVEDEPFEKGRAVLIDDSVSVLLAAKEWGIGHLLAINHPDSQKMPSDQRDVAGINHFNELPWLRHLQPQIESGS